jgi:hypothetical protein
VGQVGPDVGIGDVAEAEQEARGHDDGPAERTSESHTQF